VHQLAFRQEPQGHWLVGDYRPPQEYSSIAATAFAIRGLQVYAPPGRAKEMKERVDRARRWLVDSRPYGAEEHATRLLGLGWTKVSTFGFPYGHDQWISAAGSSWAMLSLLLTVPETK
jgi:hypothetical protein